MPRIPEDQPITYDQLVDYRKMDPAKISAQQKGLETASNLERFGAREISASRGESAYVWEEADCYRALVLEDLGTKSLVADQMRKITGRTYYEAVAQDTVAMIVNDLSVVGASPQVVNAYFGLGASEFLEDGERTRDLLKGWADACNMARAVYGGGETPTLKGLINPKNIVLAGAGIGRIDPKERLTLGDKLKSGDSILLIGSSGIHANGITLARTIIEDLEDYTTALSDGEMYGEAVLKPTHIYSRFVDDMFESGLDVHYMANVTGHGWRKLMRAPREFTYLIDNIPEPQPVFNFIKEKSRNSDEDMYGTFNMGAGFAVFMPGECVDQAQKIATKNGFSSLNAGSVQEGPRRVVIEPKGIVFEGDTLQIR